MSVGTGVGPTITVDDLERDPYPIYRRLRDEEPVSWVEAVGLWLVTRWDDVEHVDLHPDVFTGETEPSTLNRTFGKNLLGSEGDYHTRIRSIIEPAFRPGAVRPYAAAVIEPIANELIDRFVSRGDVDLMHDFAEPLSVRTLQQVLGLSEVPVETLMTWFEHLGIGASNFEFDQVKQGAGRLTRPEICSNLKVMIVGGMQEPGDLIGIATWALLTHPAQAGEVRNDPALVKPAIEEAMRWQSPVGTSTRQTTRPTTLAGVDLDEGALIAAVVSSANRDERRWTEPDRFDVHRKEGAHLAFAVGPHHCVGSWLARVEARTAIRVLFERLPQLRLAPDDPVELRGWEFRRPMRLHVRWDA